MSGSGGFFRYPCKNYYSDPQCNRKVYQNGAACAVCIAEGRDSDDSESLSKPWKFTTEISVPRVQNGVLQYCLMDLVNIDGFWGLREKANPLTAAGIDPLPAPATITRNIASDRY